MRSKKKTLELIEKCRVRFQKNYEKEFGGTTEVITIINEEAKTVTFYVYVHGENRKFNDALRFNLTYTATMEHYSINYPAKYRMELEARDWRTERGQVFL